MAVGVLCTASLATAQVPTKSPLLTGSKAESSAKPSQPKLTAQQKLGLAQLKTAQAEAAGLQPDMRAFVLWQASRGYAKVDPSKANSLLKEGLTVTQAIESPEESLKECGEPAFCGPRHWLQEQILRDMIRQSKQSGLIEQFLASAEPEFRQLLCSELLDRYINEKNFDRAHQLLTQVADEQGYFPYGDATHLIEAFPPKQAGDRLMIFSEALDSFTQHTEELYPGFDDLAIMVLRFWEELPAPLVLQAIDQLLDGAKDADRLQQNTAEHLRVGISAEKGDAYFASVYDFRLFQLMPALEQLDQTRAENLRRENSDVRAALERYPHALNSIGAPSAESGSNEIFSIGAFGRDYSPEATADQANFEAVRQQDRILSEAEQDPRQALSDALGLPVTNPVSSESNLRASILKAIARVAVGRNAAVAREALQEMRKLVDHMPARSQTQMLEDLPDLYLRLGDEADARKTLDRLVAVAAKLYETDTDLSDPNQAFKVWWPSSNLWWRCIAFAAKFNPSPAEQIIEGIQDDEIKAFERIAFANSLLGLGPARFPIIERHKNGLSAFMH
jgi:hypothetical protein